MRALDGVHGKYLCMNYGVSLLTLGEHRLWRSGDWVGILDAWMICLVEVIDILIPFLFLL